MTKKRKKVTDLHEPGEERVIGGLKFRHLANMFPHWIWTGGIAEIQIRGPQYSQKHWQVEARRRGFGGGIIACARSKTSPGHAVGNVRKQLKKFAADLVEDAERRDDA